MGQAKSLPFSLKEPMPLYEFSCSTCGRKFERNLPFDSNREGLRCPVGHHRVRRLYAAPPVTFKGSGFYVTDHPASSSGSDDKSL
jgi:putative FmdB family regulatory protein